MAEGIKLNEIDVNIENDPFENIKSIMEHIKSTMEDIKQKKSKLNNVVIKSFNDLNNKIGKDFYSKLNKFIGELNETKRVNDVIGNALDSMNNKKNTELDNSIIKSFNDLNNKIGDNFYSKFISEINETKRTNDFIGNALDNINNKKNTELDNSIIKSFNELNNKIGDNFYSKFNKFISEINETKHMNDVIGNALDNINNKKNTELDNSIIKSFNELNNKIGDNFYSKFNKFISELNKTKHMNDTIGNTLNATNNKKNTELDNSIIKLFNANMVMTNKWLNRYFSLNNELMNAMKPDANIARNLSKAPTFLPNIGMGVITNKFGKRYGNMKEKFSNLKLPEIPNVLPPGLDYDTFNLVVKNENAENGNKEMILDEVKRLDEGRNVAIST